MLVVTQQGVNGGTSSGRSNIRTVDGIKGVLGNSAFRDGTSNTAWFCESREEQYAAWISGLSMYVVASKIAPGGPNYQQVTKVSPGGTQPAVLGYGPNGDLEGQSNLNVGAEVKRATPTDG